MGLTLIVIHLTWSCSVLGRHGYCLGIAPVDRPLASDHEEGREDWRFARHEHGRIVSFYFLVTVWMRLLTHAVPDSRPSSRSVSSTGYSSRTPRQVSDLKLHLMEIGSNIMVALVVSVMVLGTAEGAISIMAICIPILRTLLLQTDPRPPVMHSFPRSERSRMSIRFWPPRLPRRRPEPQMDEKDVDALSIESKDP